MPRYRKEPSKRQSSCLPCVYCGLEPNMVHVIGLYGSESYELTCKHRKESRMKPFTTTGCMSAVGAINIWNSVMEEMGGGNNYGDA